MEIVVQDSNEDTLMDENNDSFGLNDENSNDINSIEYGKISKTSKKLQKEWMTDEQIEENDQGNLEQIDKENDRNGDEIDIENDNENTPSKIDENNQKTISNNEIAISNNETIDNQKKDSKIINDISKEISIREQNRYIPRLMIEKVVLDDFKSYGGRKIIGPFHKRFSAIVGPNGSGKSNVIDAMLFVFGRRAKDLRRNKVAELIHRSSKRSGDIQKEQSQNDFSDKKNSKNVQKTSKYDHITGPKCATVSVYFQDIIDPNPDSEEYEVVDDSKLIISREARADGTSRYLINFKLSTYTEVTKILKKRGINMEDNRFLILQGEVEMISQMKPKAMKPDEEGLLEYLEDIIGSQKYVEQINSLAKELELLEEQYQETYSRWRASKKELTNLEAPRHEAESYIRTEKELYLLYLKRAFKKRHMEFVKYNGCYSRFQLMMDRKNKADLEEEKITEKSELIGQALAKMDKQMGALENEKKIHDDILKKLEHEDDENQLRRTYCYAKDSKMKEEISQKKSDQPKLIAKAKALLSEAQDLEKRIPGYEAEVIKLQADFDALNEASRDELNRVSIRRDKAELELAPIQKELDELKKNQRALETEKTIVEQRAKKGFFELQSLQNAHTETLNFIKNAEELSRSESIKKEAKDLDLKTVRHSLEQSKKEYENACAKFAESKMRYETYKNRISVRQDHNHLSRTISEAANAGRLQGVHGRLGDLATIDPKYSQALRAAFSQADYYITDTPQQADAIFALARQKDLGRVSCLAVDFVTKDLQGKMNAPFRPPMQGVQRLFDLVKPTDEKYRVLFYFGLRNTLLAKNLDEATNLGYMGGGNRVVSMDGEIVEADGRMSAGGNKHGGAGIRTSAPESDISPRMVEAARVECDALQQSIYELQSNKAVSSRRLDELHDSIGMCKDKIAEAAMDCRNHNQKLHGIKSRIEALGNVETTQEEEMLIQSLDKKISAVLKNVKKIEGFVSLKNQEIKKIKEEFQTAGAEKIQACKQTIIAAIKKVEAAKKKACQHKVDAETASKNAENTSKECKMIEEQIGKNQEQIVKHQEIYDQLEVSGSEVQTKLDVIQDKFEAALTERNEIVKMGESITEALTNRSLAKIDLENEIQQCGADVEVCENRILQYYENIKNYLSEIYQLPYIEETTENIRDSNILQCVDNPDGESNENMDINMEDGSMETKNRNSVHQEAIEEAQKINKKCKEDFLKNIEKRKEKLNENKRRKVVNDKHVKKEIENNHEEKNTENNKKANHESNSEKENYENIEKDENYENNENYENHEKKQGINDTGQIELFEESLYMEPSEDVLQCIDIREVETDIACVEKQKSKQTPNLTILDDYKRQRDDVHAKQQVYNQAFKKREIGRLAHESLSKQRLEEFLTGFRFIATRLKEMYQMITRGGDAELELVDAANPFQGGVNFSVRPPKKSWKQIQNLSGGEKTLSSLALVFALHYLKPTPVYFMDEIDAALDYHNVSIIATYIKEKTKNAQFIIISLRHQMFEHSNRLIGIYKTFDVTKSISIDPKNFQNVL